MATKKKEEKVKDQVETEVKDVNEATDTEGTVAAPAETPVEAKPKAPTKDELTQQEADAFKAEHGKEGEDIDAIFYDTQGPWPLLSRAAAIKLGSRRYYLGTPCPKEHDSPRKTKTCACLECSRLRLRERHKDRLKNDADYKAKHAEKAKARRVRKKDERDAAKAAEAAQTPAAAE